MVTGGIVLCFGWVESSRVGVGGCANLIINPSRLSVVVVVVVVVVVAVASSSLLVTSTLRPFFKGAITVIVLGLVGVRILSITAVVSLLERLVIAGCPSSRERIIAFRGGGFLGWGCWTYDSTRFNSHRYDSLQVTSIRLAMMRFGRISKQPSPYRSPLLFHAVRTGQVLSSVVVTSILGFFIHHLSVELYYVPWTFILVRVLLAYSAQVSRSGNATLTMDLPPHYRKC